MSISSLSSWSRLASALEPLDGATTNQKLLSIAIFLLILASMVNPSFILKHSTCFYFFTSFSNVAWCSSSAVLNSPLLSTCMSLHAVYCSLFKGGSNCVHWKRRRVQKLYRKFSNDSQYLNNGCLLKLKSISNNS